MQAHPTQTHNASDLRDAITVHTGVEDIAKVRISATTLGDMLLTSWDRDPDKVAVVFPGERVTYDQLARRALHRAKGLHGLGVLRGDHVGVLLPSGVEFIETLFAVALCGAVSVLMNARYKAPELAYVAENADLVAILTNDAVAEHVDFAGRLSEAFPEIATAGDGAELRIGGAPKLRRLVLFGQARAAGFIDQGGFDAAAEQVDDAVIHAARLGVRIRDTCMLLYTSGTSANPKGCLLSHEAIVREAINLGRNRWAFTEADRIWSPLPLFHIAAMLAMLAALEGGGTFIGLPHFDAGASLRQIEDERATMLFLPFVTFHQAMIALPEFADADMSSVKLMNSCFAAMPDVVGEVYRGKTPDCLQVGTFGMTEGSGIVATGGYGMDPEMGFKRMGWPLAGIEVRIVGIEDGRDLPTGAEGEVLVRGYNLFDGYHRDPEKTAEALDADGWYHTGDIGSVDADGHVMFHGRFKDMLKVGGENVAAAEVEAVLARHPSVKLAQVVGIPDARLAEIPAAFVEFRADELISYTKARLASFKAPRHVRFVDDWPMGASKIQKFKLRKSLMEELGIDG